MSQADTRGLSKATDATTVFLGGPFVSQTSAQDKILMQDKKGPSLIGKILVLASAPSVDLWIIPAEHSTKELHQLIDANRKSDGKGQDSEKLARVLHNPTGAELTKLAKDRGASDQMVAEFEQLFAADYTTGLCSLAQYRVKTPIDCIELPAGSIYRVIVDSPF